MAKTMRDYKGFEYKDKHRPRLANKKFFGHTDGCHKGKDGRGGKKLVDFVNYGWPFETRHKSVIEQKIRDDIDRDLFYRGKLKS